LASVGVIGQTRPGRPIEMLVRFRPPLSVESAFAWSLRIIFFRPA
jgi:hypothetical protein